MWFTVGWEYEDGSDWKFESQTNGDYIRESVEGRDHYWHYRTFSKHFEPYEEPSLDICGYCGESGADKYALWTGGGVYWPGEMVPDTELVHSECERRETERAFSALSKEERERFMRSIR
jgi:hypothetical protein